MDNQDSDCLDPIDGVLVENTILVLRQDISFTRRGRGLTAVGALMFDKIIFGRQLVLGKLINQ